MLHAEHLHYRAGTKPLLHDVSLRVEPGELLAIVGPNGAGKSTLLKCCAGELTPQNGTVRLKGQPLGAYANRPLARLRAMLHQQNALSFPFRVDELVLLGRYPHYVDYPTPDDYRQAETALHRVGMAAFANRVVTSLSGGEQQRVHLARVLAQLGDATQGLLLLDEPTTGLDLLHQHHLLSIARQMAARGLAVVAVLHDLNMAAQYAHQLLLLRGGRVEAVGSPRQVLTAPLIERVFGLPVQLMENPCHQCPLIIPLPQTHSLLTS